MKLLLQETQFDLLAITETHLNKDIHEDNEISIDQYSLIRKDRTGQTNHWGSVLTLFNDKTLTRDFKQLLAEKNLVNHIKDYTRITDSSKTLIDLVITASPSKVTKSVTFGTGISDRDLMYVVVNLFRKKTPPKLIPVRNYKGVDIVKIKDDIESVPWHIISVFDDVDNSLWCWQHLFKM